MGKGGVIIRNFDYSALKDVKWDSELMSYVAQIHEHKGKQELYLRQKPAQLERLVEIAKIQSIETSNRIEGIVTTSTRIKQLCMDKTTPKNRDEEEIMGYRDVLNTIHESYEYIPIRKSYILQLHQYLYKYSEKGIGGRFKNTQNYIAQTQADGSQTILFMPPPPYETEAAIDAICETLNREMDACTVDPLILIATFIKDFLCIHPFNDGNGRMSRLLTTLLLYRCGYVVGRYVSLESKIEKTKSVYYEVLRESSEGWHEETNDNTSFIKYLLGTILAAYRDFDDRMGAVNEKLPAIEVVQRAIQGKLGKFTKREIIELCPSLGKATVESAIKQLCDLGKVEKHGVGRSTFYTRND